MKTKNKTPKKREHKIVKKAVPPVQKTPGKWKKIALELPRGHCVEDLSMVEAGSLRTALIKCYPKEVTITRKNPETGTYGVWRQK